MFQLLIRLYYVKKHGCRRIYVLQLTTYRCTSLSKSVSHHAISNKTNECELNSAIIPKHGVHLPELCRSATQAIPTIDINDGPSMSIAERLAALQRSGNTNWKRRIASESSNSMVYDIKLILLQNQNILHYLLLVIKIDIRMEYVPIH